MILLQKRNQLLKGIFFAVAFLHCGARHHDHADGDRAAVADGKRAGGFHRVTERVPEV